MPVERCFDWESLTLVSLAVGDAEAADRYAGLAEEDAARLPLRLPTALAGRCRAAVLLAAGEPLEAARVAHESAEAAARGRERDCRPPSRAASRGVRSRPRASERRRSRCCARPSRSSTACGSVRVRDEMRRELRRARSAGGAARAGNGRRQRDRGVDQARARDRRPRHRSDDESRDRDGALPQRQDGRVAHAQHLPQARRLVPGRRRAGGRARAASGRRSRRPP